LLGMVLDSSMLCKLFLLDLSIAINLWHPVMVKTQAHCHMLLWFIAFFELYSR
jgi:hypothetical protein